MPANLLLRQLNAVCYKVRCREVCKVNVCWPILNAALYDNGLHQKRLLSTKLDDTFDEELEHALLYDDDSFFIKSFFSIPGTSQRLLLIQPKPSVFTNAKRQVHPLSNPELQLEENIALVHSLPGWRVVRHRIVNAASYRSSHIFGSGNFESIVQEVQSESAISGVFIGIDLFSGEQYAVFQEAFSGLPVYDRYRIVLEIFQQHAKSSEAKLQIELAKIPVLRRLLHRQDRDYKPFLADENLMLASTTRELSMDRIKKAIRDREAKLRKALVRLRLKRQMRRKYRTEANVPSVAVVGYTNAGKTSLIRSLSRDEKLMPRDYLFATLDVTAHPSRLLNGIKIVYLDTIGFISDMPTSLLESFSAVLEEVMEGTVIVHVRDISHPDRKYQKETVLELLRALNLPDKKLANIIEVCNKTDKLGVSDEDRNSFANVDNDDDIEPGAIMMSLVDGTGLDELKARIEQSVTKLAGYRQVKFSLSSKNANTELLWLYEHAFVQHVGEHPSDAEKLAASVLIDLTTMKKFQASFGKMKRDTSGIAASSVDVSASAAVLSR